MHDTEKLLAEIEEDVKRFERATAEANEGIDRLAALSRDGLDKLAKLSNESSEAIRADAERLSRTLQDLLAKAEAS